MEVAFSTSCSIRMIAPGCPFREHNYNANDHHDAVPARVLRIFGRKRTIAGQPILLSERQMARIPPRFLLSDGVTRVDDGRVISGITYLIRHGLKWKDPPKARGPHKILYSRFVRRSLLGVVDRIFMALAREGGKPERIMIDARHLLLHLTAGQVDDHQGARTLLPHLPRAAALIADSV